VVTGDVVFRVRPKIENTEMERLHAEGFEHPVAGYDWASLLEHHSLTWIGAYRRGELVGFVNVAWDGGVHAFLPDTAVAAQLRHREIGTRLVREAIAAVRRIPGIEWLHVDSDEQLMSRFYVPAGFDRTPAGIVKVGDPPPPSVFEQTLVRRRGEVVIRSAKPWTPAVHALLRHLEAVGFEGAPRVVGSGFDDEGNETLTWVEGEVHSRGQRTIEAAWGVGRLLKSLHEATASFRSPVGAIWRSREAVAEDRCVIGHGDTGPWNVVLREAMPYAFIDWDFAGPVDRVDEVASTAMLNANLYSDDIIELNGLPSLDYRLGQLRAVVVDGYELPSEDREGVVDRMLESTVRSMAADTWEAGVTPETKESDALWALAWQARTADWLLRNRGALEGALS
jgi:GNAT superfamily N-acetyltransferase